LYFKLQKLIKTKLNEINTKLSISVSKMYPTNLNLKIINFNNYYIPKLFQSLDQITTASVNKIILEEPLGVRLGHFFTMYRI